MAFDAVPVNAPTNVVVVNAPVLGLYVNPVSVRGLRLPVAALANSGYLVAAVVLSAVKVTADAYDADDALPVNVAVIVPAAKFPLALRVTTVFIMLVDEVVRPSSRSASSPEPAPSLPLCHTVQVVPSVYVRPVVPLPMSTLLAN